MSTTVLRARLLTAGGALVAASALAAATLVGSAAFADDHTDAVTVEATVNDTISLTAADATVQLAEAPGETATASSSLTVESNSFAGYGVTVEAASDELTAQTAGNEDVISVSALELNDVPLSHDGETATPTAVHTTEVRSDEGGDSVPVDYDLAVPFIAADTYEVGLTFTATAN